MEHHETYSCYNDQKGIQKKRNAEENNPPPHLFALGSVCLQLFCELEPFAGIDFNSTLTGKLRTREHSHNVMQTRFVFVGTQGKECELVGGR